MYSEKVLDHFSNPRNVGEIPDANGIGEAGNARCGDIMKMYLKIDDNTITDVKFKTFGCGTAIATRVETPKHPGRSTAPMREMRPSACMCCSCSITLSSVHPSVVASAAKGRATRGKSRWKSLSRRKVSSDVI